MSTSSLPVILITGANKGLGYACVVELVSDEQYPDAIILLGSRSEDNAKKALQQLTSEHSTARGVLNGRVKPFLIDVNEEASIKTAIERVKQEYGRLDVLLSNAGIALYEHNLGTAKQCLTTNVIGPIHLTNLALPLLKASQSPLGPRIIYVSSEVGSWTTYNTPEPLHSVFEKADDYSDEKVISLVNEYYESVGKESAQWPNPGKTFGSYGVSKAILNVYARSVAKRIKEEVAVVIVCPGYCKTDLNNNSGVRGVDVGAKSILGGLTVNKQDSAKGTLQDGKYLPFSRESSQI